MSMHIFIMSAGLWCLAWCVVCYVWWLRFACCVGYRCCILCVVVHILYTAHMPDTRLLVARKGPLAAGSSLPPYSTIVLIVAIVAP